MCHIGSHNGISSLVSQGTDLSIDLSSVPTALAPAFEDVVLIRIYLTGPERTWGRQRRLWGLSEVFPHRIASQVEVIGNRPQAHHLTVQFLDVLIQLPFA